MVVLAPQRDGGGVPQHSILEGRGCGEATDTDDARGGGHVRGDERGNVHHYEDRPCERGREVAPWLCACANDHANAARFRRGRAGAAQSSER